MSPQKAVCVTQMAHSLPKFLLKLKNTVGLRFWSLSMISLGTS